MLLHVLGQIDAPDHTNDFPPSYHRRPLKLSVYEYAQCVHRRVGDFNDKVSMHWHDDLGESRLTRNSGIVKLLSCLGPAYRKHADISTFIRDDVVLGSPGAINR